MAPSSFILVTLFSLALVAGITEARMAPGQYNNRQAAAKDEALVEAIEHLMHGELTSLASKKKGDCHTSGDNEKEKAFLRDFEPGPNASAYPDDAKLEGETAFKNDFEPKPRVTTRPDEDAGLRTEKELVKDSEPRPNLSVCRG